MRFSEPTTVRESRNPYVGKDGVPVLRRSVVAFIDILGYADIVRAAAVTRAKSQELLRTLHGVLHKARSHVDPEKKGDFARGFQNKDFSGFRAFTDNIVIGHPVLDDGELELGAIFLELSYFQMTMTMEGFFIRGAIAIGDLYMDDIAVYGSGLIEAYEAETTLARDPRIVLGPSAQKAVNQHLQYYGRGSHAPQNQDLLKDSDGQYFVHYMNTLIGEEGEICQRELTRHKKQIELKLAEYRHRPPVWSKYLWAANYHNYFCEYCPGVDDASNKVDTDEFALKPVRIVDSA
jgi:hypothetical protein